MPNGKPQHVLGLLGSFEKAAARNAAMLTALSETGVALVGVDPSMTLAYRAEYAKALGADRAPKVSLPQEWLMQQSARLPNLALDRRDTWSLLPHCTEKTNAAVATADWIKLGRRLGIELEVVPSGCCGMAGLYGHERDNRATSEQIYRLSWEKILDDPRRAGRVLATGYSCRCQASIMGGVELRHPLQLLLETFRKITIKDELR
ncbi:(Fe-S)-binding protein [Variovorax saccharolyticus]|uniref:(Fe-S)-binding protein n=1 Tax=Variovorax saccharolyticus TaxID=3053516 RepID=UPI00257861B4|nr:(Fe-S)-binding protein [Variovorax sp. J22R187]MDM0018842.1 (Fe-S)-binding protein [Variovorax sp. J22R187]